ncbi:hypothetical protein Hte_009562 [Hypoxylon texense]
MVDIKTSSVLTQDRQRVYLEGLLDLLGDLPEEAIPQHPNDNTTSTKKSMIMDMSNTTMDTVRIMVIRRKTCTVLPVLVVLALAGEGDLLHPALEGEADRCVVLLSLVVVVALQAPVGVIHLIEAADQVL